MRFIYNTFIFEEKEFTFSTHRILTPHSQAKTLCAVMRPDVTANV